MTTEDKGDNRREKRKGRDERGKDVRVLVQMERKCKKDQA